MRGVGITAEHVLEFWFGEIDAERWWRADPDFDALLRQRFGDALERAVRGELHAWRADMRGRLAEILVLDQFSRNVFRDTPRAFAQDATALVLSQEALRAGALPALAPQQRSFLLMPWMHSESAAIHAEAEPLFREWTPEETHRFELRHKAVIDRFGRYPHRNAILGRVSTPEELAFLQEPGSSF